MIATSRNLDIICLQLRNYYPVNEDPLRKDLDKLLIEIKNGIINSSDIKPFIDKTIASVFNLRIKAIKWFFEQQKFDLYSVYDDAYAQFEDLKLDSRLEFLAENLLFAIRTNKRVVDALIIGGDFSQSTFEQYGPTLPTLTYNQFITAIALGIADETITQKIIDWTNSSLYIEFISVAAFIIKDEKLNISRKVINQLAFLVADAAQDYSAIAMELGIIKTKPARSSSFQFSFDDEYILEQKKMADLGLDNYIANLIQ